MLIYEHSRPGRMARAQYVAAEGVSSELANDLGVHARSSTLGLPEVSELEVVRHYTNLSSKNFAIDKQFYPLGSCTMKYNPRGAHAVASIPGFLKRHPLAPLANSQGYLSCAYELQNYLKDVTGMQAVSLTPMAGAQGEFAGVAMIRAYHQKRGDHERVEILVPEAAHGTNPATAVMCGFVVREIPVTKEGDVDLEALKAAVGPRTAGLMMTNPSTCGVFERQIQEIAETVHEAGGLLYYDGANLNAILGKDGTYRWLDHKDIPDTIGRLSSFMGNAGILLRAYAYARLLGAEGMNRVGEYATLNANYLAKSLEKAGYTLAYPARRATHEFIVTLASEAKHQHVTAMDFAKRLLDYGYHAPTTYFPLLVPECLLIEPTETESKAEIDGFVAAMTQIRQEAMTDPALVTTAPHTLPVTRLDDVKAARDLDLAFKVTA